MKSQTVTTLQDKLRDTNRLLNYYTQFIGDCFGGNEFSDVALEKTIELCVDICRRNGIPRLNYTGDIRGNLTKHEWFAKTNCPGPYLGSQFPYIASEVNKRLNGGGNHAPLSSGLYRVRLSWHDAQSQKGAIKQLENAKKCADQNSGYFVFDEKGNVIYPTMTKSTSNLDEIARQVLNGQWGNGAQRKSALNQAGYDYHAVQSRVNELASGKIISSLKSIDTIAREVIDGKWGNGSDRRNRLTQAGYEYNQGQQKVNELLK